MSRKEDSEEASEAGEFCLGPARVKVTYNKLMVLSLCAAAALSVLCWINLLRFVFWIERQQTPYVRQCTRHSGAVTRWFCQ